MARIIALRLSALGDIAMTMAVLKSFADLYPEHEITLLSRPHVAPLLEGMPANVHFRPVKVSDYKGTRGLRRLARELRDEGYDMMADMHNVLRTKVLRFFLKLSGRKVAVIKKRRMERRQLTRRNHKKLRQLTPSPERYAAVLAKLGYPIALEPYHIYGDEFADISDMADITGPQDDTRWVGIAPFAAHEGKVYPLEQMRSVVEQVAAIEDTRIFLFGNGDKEREWCESFTQDNVISMVGKSNLQKELRLMTHLDVMVTMDSANMHLAALANTPTLSIWGATHPFAGFTGMQVRGSKIIQKEMDCRPCSVYGNKPCMHGDYRCLSGISAEEVVDEIRTFLHHPPSSHTQTTPR